MLGGQVHFNIPIGYWYKVFLNLDIVQEHEYSNIFHIDILSGSL